MSDLTLERILAETPEAKPLWDGLAAGVFQLQRCGTCARLRFPPVASCPYCGTVGGEWEQVGLRGTVYSWVTTHVPFEESLADQVPYVVATVELDAGPRVFARLTDLEGEPSAGLVVEGYFHAEDGLPFLRFRPPSRSDG
ncbi:MAG: OB-fold domain-containing protein [Solirubrobacterales bacterium]